MAPFPTRQAEPFSACNLCPRRCGCDRTIGQKGYCRETAELRIAHAGAHFGEEPPFSGTHGSGTIFFSGCSARCLFCQNWQISVGNAGDAVSPPAFLKLAQALLEQGVHNLNFVTPDHFWPHIENLIVELRTAGCQVPMLYNSSGYQLPELMPRVAEYINIFLPDFKFADSALAKTFMNAPDYPEVALAALREMVRARGFLDPFDPSGLHPARTGVLVRHLVLPGYVDNSLAVLRILHREFGPQLPLSLMSQFQPTPACRQRELLTRGVSKQEYDQVLALVEDLGFENVFTQEVSEQTEYLPDFTQDEPFAGNRRRET